jgi:ribonuclease E
MLETELNDAEPNGEERSSARSPDIETAAGRAPTSSRPAESSPPAGRTGDDQPPVAKGRRRPARRRSGAAAESGTPDAPRAATEAVGTAPGAASPDTGAAVPSAVFAGPETAAAGAPAGTGASAGSAVPAATFQPPQAIFQAPPEEKAADAGGRGRRPAESTDDGEAGGAGQPPAEHDDGEADGQGQRRRRRRGGRSRGHGADTEAATEAGGQAGTAGEATEDGGPAAADANGAGTAEPGDTEAGDGDESSRRRRRRRRSTSPDAEQASPDEPPNTVVHVRPGRSADEPSGEVQPVRGSTRLEAKRQRRREGRDSGRRRPPIITESEFLARREAVDRVMVVRQRGERTQIGVLEDGVLVEHYVDKASHQSFVGNVYLGKVQNVLPSMEAAFVDIGKGRNAVLYAGEVNFDASGLEGESKRIESALKSGQSVLVQVTKDPVGHKGARLTSQVSLPGRYLVYVPGGSMMGISRKLPDKERTRLKQILKQVMPEGAGVIVRTAAEGASEEELAHDVSRLSAQWESIDHKAKSANAPDLLYSEPDLTIRVVRDIFNEDFSKLVVSGDDDWDMVDEYVRYVAPHLADRLEHWQGDEDAFAHYRIDEQLTKALDRKVWLPSGGSLVIDTTEAMTVIDVNTGKFTGQGGNLEETVTRNNLEAAEEIVRQLRLRDVGGIIVIDFIDMVLESNRDLVLRRLLECLARDRTKHQVAEVTSLGLVQMTRKRVGSGLLEAFSEPCECCNGRGVIVSLDLIDRPSGGRVRGDGRAAKGGRQSRNGKNGRDTGRHVPEPAIADADSAGANGDAALDEAGLDRTVTDRPAAETAEPGAAGADGDRAEDGGTPPFSGGRRRRRAATRQQGPPEPVGQRPDAEPSEPAGQQREANMPEPAAQQPDTESAEPVGLRPDAETPASAGPGAQELIAVVPGLLLPAAGEPVAPAAGAQAPGADAADGRAPDGGSLDGEVSGPPAAPEADPPPGDGQPAEPATG